MVERIRGSISFASQKRLRQQKAGKEYENVMLMDKTGQLDSKNLGP